jgi:hypothetical protein
MTKLPHLKPLHDVIDPLLDVRQTIQPRNHPEVLLDRERLRQ